MIETAVATLHAYAGATGAQRVVALLDVGEGDTGALIEWTAAGAILTVGDEDRPIATDGAPGELPALRALPTSALHVDPQAGEIHAPLGAIGHLLEGIRSLAAALGGRSVAAVDFATADRDVILTLAARGGEPVMAAVGDVHFEVPE